MWVSHGRTNCRVCMHVCARRVRVSAASINVYLLPCLCAIWVGVRPASGHTHAGGWRHQGPEGFTGEQQYPPPPHPNTPPSLLPTPGTLSPLNARPCDVTHVPALTPTRPRTPAGAIGHTYSGWAGCSSTHPPPKLPASAPRSSPCPRWPGVGGWGASPLASRAVALAKGGAGLCQTDAHMSTVSCSRRAHRAQDEGSTALLASSSRLSCDAGMPPTARVQVGGTPAPTAGAHGRGGEGGWGLLLLPPPPVPLLPSTPSEPPLQQQGALLAPATHASAQMGHEQGPHKGAARHEPTRRATPWLRTPSVPHHYAASVRHRAGNATPNACAATSPAHQRLLPRQLSRRRGCASGSSPNP